MPLRSELHDLVEALPEDMLAIAKDTLEHLPRPPLTQSLDVVADELLHQLKQKLVILESHGAAGTSISSDGEHGVASGFWVDRDWHVIETHHLIGGCGFVVEERLRQSTQDRRVRYKVTVLADDLKDEREFEFRA